MFLPIFQWMLDHVPGFMRPGVTWLLDGLRAITNYISGRWASLGRSATYWWQRLTAWFGAGIEFALTLGVFVVWLVVVFVPQYVARKTGELGRVLRSLIAAAVAAARAGLDNLQRWARAGLDNLLRLLTLVRDWAVYQFGKLIDTVGKLLRALVHVLSGPDVLAAWLAGAMWRAFLRLLYSQRERIASWLTRESVTFTRWLALEVESILLRWL